MAPQRRWTVRLGPPDAAPRPLWYVQSLQFPDTHLLALLPLP